jgi:hypothetical protein
VSVGMRLSRHARTAAARGPKVARLSHARRRVLLHEREVHYNPRVVLPRRRTRPAPFICGCALFLLVLISAVGPAASRAGGDSLQARPSFASQVAALSEPGGYFDTDNLISNERSYLQVIPELRRGGIRGGAYIGVGPDTNFSYIAEVKPSIALIIDVRRDNLLLHLLFKALFELSATRAEYLALLFGRPVPPAIDGWRGAPIDRLVTYFDRATPAADASGLRRRVDDAIKRCGVALSAEDLATIGRFHQRFIEAGLGLRFNSAGRPPQAYYPTYRDLLLETDSAGRQANYLASEEAFQLVRSLQARDLVIPVVGDLGGPTAMSAIARLLVSRNEALSVFYTSNVEFYLYGQGTFSKFAGNLKQIPRAERSVVIRSVFGRYTGYGRPGDASTSQVHSVNDLLSGLADGRFASYGQLVAR